MQPGLKGCRGFARQWHYDICHRRLKPPATQIQACSKQAPRPAISRGWAESHLQVTWLLIGVGRASCPSPSPLRTVRAIFPHTALQLVVHLQEDWRGRAWAVVREYSPCSAK